ncbi:unnamed protein product [Effrenium voratum]|nr:unnamed protein product [Effrenium voratum]
MNTLHPPFVVWRGDSSKCQPLTHGQVALREEALYPAGDIGRESGSHQVLGHKHVPMMLLDAISGAVLLAFMMGTLLLRDLRLWCKMFFSNGMLFVLKGIFDWVTIIPDSIGWHECERRLKPEPLEYLRKMATLDGSKYAMALWELETQGVAGIWPVRYCSDMLLSGHTAVMLLYLLGLSDLVRRTTLLMDTTPRFILRILIGFFALVCACADLYLIVKNHFHYTVDVILAIVVTLLIYTNAGVAVLTQWYVSSKEGGRNTEDNGMIWLPFLMVPFCCFSGYYTVREIDPDEVISRQADNQSQVWTRLTHAFSSEDNYGAAEPAKPEESSEAPPQWPPPGASVPSLAEKETV